MIVTDDRIYKFLRMARSLEVWEVCVQTLTPSLPSLGSNGRLEANGHAHWARPHGCPRALSWGEGGFAMGHGRDQPLENSFGWFCQNYVLA